MTQPPQGHGPPPEGQQPQWGQGPGQQQPPQGYGPQQGQGYGPQQGQPQPPPAKKKKRWPWVAGGVVLLLILVSIIGGLTGGSSDKTTTAAKTTTSAAAAPTTTTDAPAPTTQAPAPTTEAPAPTTEAPAPTTAAPAPAPAPAAGLSENNGWVLESIKVKDNGIGDFGATGRLTNNSGKDVQGALFKVTLLDGKDLVASLTGAVSAPAAQGASVTVEFISSDKYTEGNYTPELQVDGSF